MKHAHVYKQDEILGSNMSNKDISLSGRYQLTIGTCEANAVSFLSLVVDDLGDLFGESVSFFDSLPFSL